MENYIITSIESAIEEIKNGNIIIIVDDEDRENEGDFFIPAQIVKPEHINFMARIGGGLVCVSINYERFHELELEVPIENTSKFLTPFGYPIDYKDVKTGTSAYERALTARMICDETKGKEDFIRPGHLYTLCSRKGGVLERAGHTEASVDLSKLANFYPAGVICEIMDDDGNMARMPKLIEIAKKFNLKITTIRDLIAYRFKKERIIQKIFEKNVKTEYGEFKLYAYKDIYNKIHYVLEKPNSEKIKFVRVHRRFILADELFIIDDINYGKKKRALEIISKNGGAFIYLDVDDNLNEKDKVFRNYGIGAQIIRDLGYEEIIVITPNPLNYKGIEGFGIEIVDFVF